MKTLEEKIEVMQAFLDGKTIQDNIDGEWTDWTCPNPPLFEWNNHDYRVKPENKQVPYDFSDAENLIGRKGRHKEERSVSVITCVDNDSTVMIQGSWVNMKDLEEEYEIWNNTLNRWESCTKTVKG